MRIFIGERPSSSAAACEVRIQTKNFPPSDEASCSHSTTQNSRLTAKKTVASIASSRPQKRKTHEPRRTPKRQHKSRRRKTHPPQPTPSHPSKSRPTPELAIQSQPQTTPTPEPPTQITPSSAAKSSANPRNSKSHNSLDENV
jgi:hypothetical protein